jgi:hypothetical protein
MAALLLAMSLACSAASVAGTHIRSDDLDVRTLIDIGMAKSATFRSLAASLNDTDTVVYVQPILIPNRLGGYMPHRIATHAAGRYVIVAIAADASDARRIGVIGHELQHALEIAQAPEVGRTRTVVDLFARIGFRGGTSRGAYETIAAIDVERAIRDELVKAAPPCSAE